MPSPIYRLLTAHFPLSDQRLAQQLVDDLRDWDFDPNETHENRLIGVKQPCSLLQVFVVGLPKNLTEKDPLAPIALEVVDVLLQKGADPDVLDFHGNHVENLAPDPLRAKLVRAQGRDVQRDQAIQSLKTILKQTMATNAAVSTLKDMEDEEGNAPYVLGHPLVNWVLANGHAWSSETVMNKDDSWTNGQASIARVRSAQVRQLIAWSKDLPDPQSELAEFLGWCTAWGANKSDGSRGDHWDRLLLKLEPDEPAHAQRLEQARAYLTQDFGELTGHVMHSIAEACVDFGDTTAGPIWAQSLGRLHAQPGALDPARRVSSGDAPYILPIQWRSTVLPRLRRGAPQPGTDYAQAWLDHFTAPLGTALVAMGIAECHRKNVTPNPSVQQAWRAWAEHWLEAHPDQGMALKIHLSRASLEDGVQAKLQAWLMDVTLPAAEVPQRKPRM